MKRLLVVVSLVTVVLGVVSPLVGTAQAQINQVQIGSATCNHLSID